MTQSPASRPAPIRTQREVSPGSGAAGRRVSRRTALAVAGGLAALLGLGWLGDSLAALPLGAASPDRSTHAVGLYRVRLTLAPAPPIAGRETSLTIAITDAAGAAVNGAHTRFALSMNAMDMGTTDLTAHASGDGQYTSAITFPMSGSWNVGVTIDIDAPGQLAATTTFVVGVR